MKVSIVVTTYLFLTIHFAARGQNFGIVWGENSKVESYGHAVPMNNGQFILLKQGKIRYSINPVLVVVDQEMRPVKETTLELAEKDNEFRDLRRYGNNIFLTYQVYDDKQIWVYAVKLNQQTLKAESKFTLASFSSDAFLEHPNVIYKTSADSTHILVFVEGLGLKKENKQVYIGVFDTNFKKIWSRYAELPMGGRLVFIEDQDITNDGNVFVSVKHFEKEIHVGIMKDEDYNGDYKVPPYDYKIFRFAKEGAYKQFTIHLPSHFVADTKLVFKERGLVTVAGLFKKSPNGNIAGAFYNTFDSTSTLISKNQMLAFPQEILELVDKDGQGKSKGSDPGVYSYLRIKDILPRRNGSVDLISEVHMVNMTKQTNMNKSFYGKEYRNYVYGDILILNLDKEGRSHFTRIPKRQEGYQTDWPLGYYPIVYDDKLLLLYNDDEDNVTRDLSKAPEHYYAAKKGGLAAAIIDDKGNLIRKTIYSFRDEKRLALPRDFSRISEKKFFIVSASGNIFSYRLGFGLLEIK